MKQAISKDAIHSHDKRPSQAHSNADTASQPDAAIVENTDTSNFADDVTAPGFTAASIDAAAATEFVQTNGGAAPAEEEKQATPAS